MSRTTLKWGAVTVISLALIGLLYFPSRHNKSSELFASDKQALNSDALHPVEQFTVNGQAKTLVAAFQQAGKTYYPEDRITAFPDPSLGLGSVITVERALPIEIQDGKRKVSVRTWQNNLTGILAENKMELGTDDQINPALTTPITASMKVTIIRVAITNVIETEPIQFQIIKKDDPTMDQGKTKVSRAGVMGEMAYTYQVRREDGIQVSKVLIGKAVTSPEVDQILLIGTRPVIIVPCRFNDWVLSAAIQNGIDPNGLCHRMMAESMGNPFSDGGSYKGLFQYEPSFWATVSVKAGYSGASIWDAKSQIYVTAWAWAHGYRGRWPNP